MLKHILCDILDLRKGLGGSVLITTTTELHDHYSSNRHLSKLFALPFVQMSTYYVILALLRYLIKPEKLHLGALWESKKYPVYWPSTSQSIIVE